MGQCSTHNPGNARGEGGGETKDNAATTRKTTTATLGNQENKNTDTQSHLHRVAHREHGRRNAADIHGLGHGLVKELLHLLDENLRTQMHVRTTTRTQRCSSAAVSGVSMARTGEYAQARARGAKAHIVWSNTPPHTAPAAACPP